MEYFLTKLPGVRNSASLPNAIEKDDVSVRYGMRIEKLKRANQKPSISFMQTIRHSIVKLFCWRGRADDFKSRIVKFGIDPDDFPTQKVEKTAETGGEATVTPQRKSNAHIQTPAKASSINPVSPSIEANRTEIDPWFKQELCTYRGKRTSGLAFTYQRAADEVSDKMFTEESDEELSPGADWMNVLTAVSPVHRLKSERATVFQKQLDKVLDTE